MPARPIPGRSLVSRRAVVDIVRSAVVASYGVTGVDAGPVERLLGRLGIGEPGIRVRLDRGIEVDLRLTVAQGLPIAEVARQVDSAVRYAVRRSLEHEVHRLAVHVAGLRYQPASVPPPPEAPRELTTSGALPDAGEVVGGADATTDVSGGVAIVPLDVGGGPADDGHASDDGRDADDRDGPAGPAETGRRKGRGEARSRRRREPAGGPDPA